jgi:hypothetical protein
MKARQLIASSHYGPEQLKVLFQAFDEAWETIAPHCGNNGLSVQAMRLKLANAILDLARENCSDAEAMKEAALRLLVPEKAAAMR